MPVITIGRQFGAGGATVGRTLAERLKIDFRDSQIIDEVARRLQIPVEDEQDHAPGLVGVRARALQSFLPHSADGTW